jgi:nitrite reductase (NADH) large subunit
MFYIKTADPLTRTATWLNKMEGGLSYLYDVVVNDSLGIGADLEKDMDRLIENYACEWKKVVENPELKDKYKHFVNVEEADPSLEFVDMRGQKCPVDWNANVNVKKSIL